jgi:hypothetical protein
MTDDLSHDLLNPLLLQPPDLLLEALNLLPAVERPAVVGNQALDNLAPRLLDALGELAQLFPLVEARPEGLNLLGHGGRAVAGRLLLGVGLGELEGLLLGRGQGGRLLRGELLQLLGDAGLDGELDGLGTRSIGLQVLTKSGLVRELDLQLDRCRLRTSVLPCSDSTISCDTPRGPELNTISLVSKWSLIPHFWEYGPPEGHRREWDIWKIRTPSRHARLGHRPSWRSSRPLCRQSIGDKLFLGGCEVAPVCLGGLLRY